MSGRGAAITSTTPPASPSSPGQRRAPRQITSHSPPPEIASSADSGMAGARLTAPGRCATHPPSASITAIPSPKSANTGPSQPSGIRITDRAAAGITQKPITGMAIRLPSTA